MEWICQYRENEYRKYYQDESRAFENMASRKVWRDKVEMNTKDLCKVPSVEGERSIISHIGCGKT